MIATTVEFTKTATAIGTYWSSPAPRRHIRDHLVGLARTRFKSAEDSGDSEQSFEQAFSSLSYAYLKDKAPRLIDFIVGFQLVDRNEDNTKAVGLFGFKVGEQWLYAPVFFLNGDLKGHELLYIKKQDAFVPMKENWVNHLISRKPHVLGEASKQNTHQLGGLLPNLTRLSRPPTGSKYGSDDTPLPVSIQAWAEPVLPLVCALATKKAAALYEKRAGDLNFAAIVERPLAAALAPVASRLDLGAFLNDFGLLKSAFERAYTAYPLIKLGFDRFYGPDFFLSKALAVKAAESYLLPPPGSRKEEKEEKKKEKKSSPFILDAEKKPEKNAGLTIYAADMDVNPDAAIAENKPELTDAEREKLLKDTVLIKDKRDPHRTSIAYNTQVRTELVNPSDTGLYHVLEKPGKFDEMVVISNPQSGRGREDFCLVLRKSSPRNWKNTHRTNLWAKSCDCPVPDDWRKYVDGLDGVDALKKDGTYVAVHHNGSGTCAFRVLEDFGDGAYSVRWEDYCSFGDKRNPTLAKLERPSDWEVGYSAWRARVYINQRKGSKLKSTNGELSIPDSYKIIKVSNPPKPKPKKERNTDCLVGYSVPPAMVMSECDGDGSADNPIQPGNLIDVQIMLTKQASTLRLHDTGTDIVVKGRSGSASMTKKAALIHLVRDHGLREEQARLMLKEAAALAHKNAAAQFLVKYADGYGDPNLQPGPGAPAFPEPQMGQEQTGRNSVNAIYPQEEFMPVDGMQSQMSDPSIYDPFYEPDQQAMQTAQQAAQSGQKEVFDTSMISGMLKSVRQDSLVDRYLGDLMKALSNLGKILFMFFWHQEEFEDRYGRQDLPELEDSIKNAFECLGDVVLFLKEKTVHGGAGVMQSSGTGAPDAGEPSVTEAARN